MEARGPSAPLGISAGGFLRLRSGQAPAASTPQVQIHSPRPHSAVQTAMRRKPAPSAARRNFQVHTRALS